jgi:hypothetical protein
VIDQPSFTLAGIVVALVLILLSWIGSRFMSSDPRRLHFRYLLAFVGFLLAAAMWAVSAGYVRDACTAPHFPTKTVSGGKNATAILEIRLSNRFQGDAVLGQLLTGMIAGGIPPDEGIWILYDHDGRVVCAGKERMGAVAMSDTIEARYPGTKTSASRVTTLVGGDGQPSSPTGTPIRLHSVWLAERSPTPECSLDVRPRTGHAVIPAQPW